MKNSKTTILLTTGVAVAMLASGTIGNGISKYQEQHVIASESSKLAGCHDYEVTAGCINWTGGAPNFQDGISPCSQGQENNVVVHCVDPLYKEECTSAAAGELGFEICETDTKTKEPCPMSSTFRKCTRTSSGNYVWVLVTFSTGGIGSPPLSVSCGEIYTGVILSGDTCIGE